MPKTKGEPTVEHTTHERAVAIAEDAHRVYGQRDNRSFTGYDGSIAEFADGHICDAVRAAVEAQKEKDAEACVDRWTNESDLTRRNALSHGCIASAAAIRDQG